MSECDIHFLLVLEVVPDEVAVDLLDGVFDQDVERGVGEFVFIIAEYLQGFVVYEFYNLDFVDYYYWVWLFRKLMSE